MEVAHTEAEKTKMIGVAEAYAIECVGKAEAEGMRMKAAAYKQYGDAAVMSLVSDALPKIAAEVSAPLAKTEDIVLIGGTDQISAEVTKLVSQILPSVQALTGVDLTKVYYYILHWPQPLGFKSGGLKRISSHMRHPFSALVVILFIHPVMQLDRLLLAYAFTIYMIARFKVDDCDYVYQKKMLQRKYRNLCLDS